MGGPPAPVVLAAVHFTRRQCGMAAGTSVYITRDVDVDHGEDAAPELAGVRGVAIVNDPR